MIPLTGTLSSRAATLADANDDRGRTRRQQPAPDRPWCRGTDAHAWTGGDRLPGFIANVMAPL